MSLAPAVEDPPSAVEAPYLLLVDDQECCLNLLRAILESAGHHCVAVGSGAEALAACAYRRPQAVITDLSMPDVDGRMLACHLKARYPALPLVLLTGQDLDAPAVEQLRPQFTTMMQKPVDPDHLLDVLAALTAS